MKAPVVLRECSDGHVDTNNPTPALDLYLSVGMKPTLVFDGWRRVLPLP